MRRFRNRLHLAMVVLLLLNMVTPLVANASAQDSTPIAEEQDSSMQGAGADPAIPTEMNETGATVVEAETVVPQPEIPAETYVPEIPAETTVPQEPTVVLVVPAAPSIVEGSCVDSTHVAPQVVAPVDTDTIAYQLTGPSASGEFTLTASLLGTAAWGDLTGSNWTVNANNVAVYDVTVAAVNPCPVPTATAEPTVEPTKEPTKEPTAGTPEATSTPGAVSRAAARSTTSTLNTDTGGYTIQKSVNPSLVVQDSTITYTIVVGFGESVANTPFIVTDEVPGVLTNVSGSCGSLVPPGAVTCSGGGSGNSLAWNIVPTGLAGEVYLTVTAHVPDGTAGQTVTNTTFAKPNGQQANPPIVASNTFTIQDKLPPKVPVNPAAPSIVQAQCIDGTVSTPSLSFPATDGITYEWDPESVVAGGSVLVTARLAPGYEWAGGTKLPNGWAYQNSTTAVRFVNFSDAECTSTVPVNPTFKDGSCLDGVYTAPKVTPAQTTGVTYSVSGPDGAGDYTVTATLKPGYSWGEMPEGWTKLNATKAAFSGKVNLGKCTEVAPVAPTTQDGSCLDGVYTPPAVTPAPNGNGITYTLSGPDSSGNYYVTAKLSGSNAWDDMPAGWQKIDAKTAKYSGKVQLNKCASVSPATPVVTQAVCQAGGTITAPALNVGPTTGITYSWDTSKVKNGGGDVVITAKLGANYAWGNLNGWTKVDNTTATKTVTFNLVSCESVSPATPVVTQAICTPNGLTQPTLAMGPTDGITYSWDTSKVKNGGGDVVITAALKQGYTWGALDGWTKSSDGKSATRTVTFVNVPCDGVSPAAPEVTQAICTPNGLTDPSLTVGPTAGITYAWDTTKVKNGGGDVIITATLQDGHSWDNLNGWTKSGDGKTATKTVTFKTVTCNSVSLADPVVTQAICTPNGLTQPTLVVGPTNGVDYTWDTSKVKNGGGEVVITATLKSSSQWGDLNGWTKSGDGKSATKTVTFKLIECHSVSLATPDVQQAICTSNGLTDPSLAVGPTTGVTYAWDASKVVNGGGDVVITATIESGYFWGELNDWIKSQDGKTATKTVTFQNVPCNSVTPATPQVQQAICTPGGLTQPTLAVGPTDGITYSWDASKVVNGGGEVVITATLNPGSTWDGLNGWTLSQDGKSATKTVTFKNVTCESASPVKPVVTQAICTPAGLTAPTLTVGATDGISYAWDTSKVKNGGGDVVITATLGEGFSWGELNGWTKSEDGKTATYTVTFENVPCERASLADPVVTQAICTPDGLTDPSLTVGPTDGITYSWDASKVVNGGGDVVITATLASGHAWGDLNGWEKSGETTATKTVTFAKVECDSANLAIPSVEQAACTTEGLKNPALTVGPTAGIAYSYDESKVVNGGGEVVITATLQANHAWGELNGWTLSEDGKTATYTVTFNDVPCDSATPATPVVTQAICTPGGLTAPTLTVGPTAGITYAWDTSKVVNGGGDVVITATIANGFFWGDLEGWTPSQDGTSATTTVRFANVPCEPVAPVDPTLTQAVCTNGELTAPSVSFPTTKGITYSYTGGLASGSTIVVTATLADGYSWGTMPTGWEQDGNTATRSFTFETVKCTEVIPAAPVVTQVACIDGGLTNPSVVTQKTPGVTYSFDETQVVNGGTVVVTAKLENGHAWATDWPQGWTKVDKTTATYEVTLDKVECTTVVPVAPTVTDVACIAGGLTDPAVVTPNTDGITYTFDPSKVVDGGTVVVTATLANGFAWGEMPTGWTKANSTTATYTVEFDDVECAPVVPVDPIVEDAACVLGGLTNPSVTTRETDGVSYSFDARDAINGGTVVVTATLANGFAWGEMPEGWTKVDATTATFTVELANVECEPVAPVDPSVTDAVCAVGELAMPKVTLRTTEGIVYTKAGAEVPGGTVIVTATLTDGYEWATMPEGWTKVDADTATYEVMLADVECDIVVPVAPTVVEATCNLDGTANAPSVTPATSRGISYTLSGDVVAGGTVVVTAKIADGFAWGEMPAGWTEVDATTATFTVTLKSVNCEKPVTPTPTPVDPTPTPVTPTPVTPTPVTPSPVNPTPVTPTAQTPVGFVDGPVAGVSNLPDSGTGTAVTGIEHGGNAGWLAFLLGSLALAGMGLAIRRREQEQ